MKTLNVDQFRSKLSTKEPSLENVFIVDGRLTESLLTLRLAGKERRRKKAKQFLILIVSGRPP